MDWYHTLKKPFFSPPDKIFAPVWTIIYILIFISFALYIKSANNSPKLIPFLLFIIQFLLNISWVPVFFGLKKPKSALLICLLLWLSVLFLIIFLYPISRIASILLIPYIIWLTFALYLNFMIIKLN